MRTDDQPSPMLGTVARLYYEHGLTHAEIGSLLGLSRVKVTRLLAEARRAGVVEISVHTDERAFAPLESELVTAFGLQAAWLCPSSEGDAERALASLGVAGAEAISSVLPHSRRIAVGLSTAVAASVAQLRPVTTPAVDVAPLAGSTGGRAHSSNPHALAAALAAATGGSAFHVPAPLVASSPVIARALFADEGVTAALDAAATADAIVVGVGGTSRLGDALRRATNERELAELAGRGAVGDLSARFFDDQGEPVDSVMNSLVVGLTLPQMRGVPIRIGVAGGSHKHRAIFTALSTGLLNVIATDRDTAQALLRRRSNLATSTSGA